MIKLVFISLNKLTFLSKYEFKFIFLTAEPMTCEMKNKGIVIINNNIICLTLSTKLS